MQQLKIVEDFVRKNKINTKIIECKTIREKNGVAYSSRNFLLSTKESLIASKIYKVIVKQKSNITQFEKFIDKLYATNVAELKIVENFQIQEAADFEAFESEDTISVLNRYIEEAEIKLDKSIVQKMVQNIYQEACELI